MSLKAELEMWAEALKEYDAERFDKALELFADMQTANASSKILTNMGLIYATLGDHETAVNHFQLATDADQYLAIAYFQCGVSNFLLERYNLAFKDFEDSLLYMRNNQAIDYEQLGLKFKLHVAEILFNKGLSQIYLGNFDAGMVDFVKASAGKVADEHKVIDEAIRDRGEGYTVFSIPVGVLYRPSENKLRNTRQKDYLGKAKLVAAADVSEAYTSFTGATRLKQGITPKGTFVSESEDKSPDPNFQLNRSMTVPAPTNMDQTNPSVPLKRSKTTISVPINRNQGSGSEPSQQPPQPQPLRSKLERSMTAVGRNPSAPRDLTAPRRGLTLQSPRRPLSPQQMQSQKAQTEGFYDYIEEYGENNDTGAAVRRNNNTVASWARNNANPQTPPLSRSPTMRPPPSSYTSTSGVRRRGTTVGRQRSVARRKPTYEEEEEGYGSGDYDDVSTYTDYSKIRVKVRFGDEVRGMALLHDTTFLEFMGMLRAKFGIPMGKMDVKFKDEDGGLVSMKDEMDYEMALETAKESANGRAEGKLEIWCTEQ